MANITGLYFSQVAYGFRDSGYTYEQYDCIHFVNLCRTTAGISQIPNGTNSCYRDPTALWWKGTNADCLNQWGGVPQGALLFKIWPEGTPQYETIPPQYYGDGVGNVTHVGIFTNLGLGVMQSGGYGGTGVHQSTYDTNYFTHVAFSREVILANIPYPGQYIDPELIVALLGRKKGHKCRTVIYPR